uniref:Uncharacterized protein n=1 Tax=Chromera velia CCMP2878 TaxID=1169474 RepID=A0A0G4HP30_9ALVE|eukprot:Cvel_1221.t1-p1 / transcript=Cvel_1221.t1 / gene=Cvel_1221 / organism=Chromera_velia_CCMP2878 / gene_product=hypothetical protein / transcript_product=hypothetical protein / location=Cvel_scaffold40:153606-163150(-) / protein_length=1440 / sequence_SO=supercontig / SO=protein_coding / is_pseudo=false
MQGTGGGYKLKTLFLAPHAFFQVFANNPTQDVLVSTMNGRLYLWDLKGQANQMGEGADAGDETKPKPPSLIFPSPESNAEPLHRGLVSSLFAFSASEHGPAFFLSGGEDGRVRSWSLRLDRNGDFLDVLSHDSAVTGIEVLKVHEDGPLQGMPRLWLTASLDGTVRLWEQQKESAEGGKGENDSDTEANGEESGRKKESGDMQKPILPTQVIVHKQKASVANQPAKGVLSLGLLPSSLSTRIAPQIVNPFSRISGNAFAPPQTNNGVNGPGSGGGDSPTASAAASADVPADFFSLCEDGCVRVFSARPEWISEESHEVTASAVGEGSSLQPRRRFRTTRHWTSEFFSVGAAVERLGRDLRIAVEICTPEPRAAAVCYGFVDAATPTEVGKAPFWGPGRVPGVMRCRESYREELTYPAPTANPEAIPPHAHVRKDMRRAELEIPERDLPPMWSSRRMRFFFHGPAGCVRSLPGDRDFEIEVPPPFISQTFSRLEIPIHPCAPPLHMALKVDLESRVEMGWEKRRVTVSTEVRGDPRALSALHLLVGHVENSPTEENRAESGKRLFFPSAGRSEKKEFEFSVRRKALFYAGPGPVAECSPFFSSSSLRQFDFEKTGELKFFLTKTNGKQILDRNAREFACPVPLKSPQITAGEAVKSSIRGAVPPPTPPHEMLEGGSLPASPLDEASPAASSVARSPMDVNANHPHFHSHTHSAASSPYNHKHQQGNTPSHYAQQQRESAFAPTPAESLRVAVNGAAAAARSGSGGNGPGSHVNGPRGPQRGLPESGQGTPNSKTEFALPPGSADSSLFPPLSQSISGATSTSAGSVQMNGGAGGQGPSGGRGQGRGVSSSSSSGAYRGGGGDLDQRERGEHSSSHSGERMFREPNGEIMRGEREYGGYGYGYGRGRDRYEGGREREREASHHHHHSRGEGGGRGGRPEPSHSLPLTAFLRGALPASLSEKEKEKEKEKDAKESQQKERGTDKEKEKRPGISAETIQTKGERITAAVAASGSKEGKLQEAETIAVRVGEDTDIYVKPTECTPEESQTSSMRILNRISNATTSIPSDTPPFHSEDQKTEPAPSDRIEESPLTLNPPKGSIEGGETQTEGAGHSPIPTAGGKEENTALTENPLTTDTGEGRTEEGTQSFHPQKDIPTNGLAESFSLRMYHAAANDPAVNEGGSLPHPVGVPIRLEDGDGEIPPAAEEGLPLVASSFENDTTNTRMPRAVSISSMPFPPPSASASAEPEGADKTLLDISSVCPVESESVHGGHAEGDKLLRASCDSITQKLILAALHSGTTSETEEGEATLTPPQDPIFGVDTEGDVEPSGSLLPPSFPHYLQQQHGRPPMKADSTLHASTDYGESSERQGGGGDFAWDVAGGRGVDFLGVDAVGSDVVISSESHDLGVGVGARVEMGDSEGQDGMVPAASPVAGWDLTWLDDDE